MTVTALDIANHRLELTQCPDEPCFSLVQAGENVISPGALPALDLLLIGGALCNDATLVRENGDVHAVGDPTEGALVLAAAAFDISKNELDPAFPRIAEVPFDSVRKRMTTLHTVPQSKEELPPSLTPMWERRVPQEPPPPYLAVTKGAVDGLLSITADVWMEGEFQPFDDTWRQRVMTAHDDLAGKGMRVLGVGIRTFEQRPTEQDLQDLENELTLVGLFGMMDPPRPEVAQAIATCKTAGIRPVMITGDHPLTARHIARQLGISHNDQFLAGQELDRMSPDELRAASREVSVFARVSPEHKLKLIQAYQEQAYIVAMTGDGVNDAPALKKADIGVAMGITGTDVSKESAEMVLLDDNFSTIVAAVEEGRIIYDNIRRFINYLLSCNASEIAVMLIGPFLGMPLPLLPLQILWMNLVTDGLPALALGVEPAEKNVMRRPPFSSTESIFGRGMVTYIGIMGVIMSLVSLAVGLAAYRLGDPAWQSLLFTTLIFSQLALALEVRSEENSLFKIGLFSNRSMVGAVLLTVLLQMLVLYVPFFQVIFSTNSLTLQDLAIAFIASLFIILVVEVWKLLKRAKNRTRAQ
jgi:Ca2+-transporting ATPase